MGRLRDVASWIGRLVDRIDERLDKPAKSRGTYTSGSEQMIDGDPVGSEMGKTTSNRRSGYGRRL
jgi:hypothetical protein